MDDKKVMEILRAAQGTCMAFAVAAAKSSDIDFKKKAVQEVRCALARAVSDIDAMLLGQPADKPASRQTSKPANQQL